MKNFIFCIISFALISCSSSESIKSDLKSQITNTLQDEMPKLKLCVPKNEQKEIRVNTLLTINENGKLDKFSVEKSEEYNSLFIDCLFNVLENTHFPKLKKGESLELDQPFIFTN